MVTRRTGLPPEAIDAWVRRRRPPQMPAYHLLRAMASGITMVNIGVGPANAKTITDHIAVLRPHAWLMLGPLRGLQSRPSLGDYACPRLCARDHVDEELPCGCQSRRWPSPDGAGAGGGRHHQSSKGYDALKRRAAHWHRRQHRQPQLGVAAPRGAATSELRFAKAAPSRST